MTSGTGRPRSLRAAHRLSAWAVVLLWCAAPLLAALHAGAEAHRYCAEHDAVEEAAEAAAGVLSDQTGPLARGPEDPAPGHEDCSFTRFCRFGQLVAQLILDDAGDLEPVSLPTPPLAPAPGVAVIVIAPKTSPPV